MIKFKSKWFGDDAIQKIKNALAKGIDKATDDVYGAAQKKWPVDTGKSKKAMKRSPVKTYKASIRSRVTVPVDYAIWVEFRQKPLRRALMEAEKKSLAHFEGKL